MVPVISVYSEFAFGSNGLLTLFLFALLSILSVHVFPCVLPLTPTRRAQTPVFFLIPRYYIISITIPVPRRTFFARYERCNNKKRKYVGNIAK